MDIIILALPRWDGPYSSTAYSYAKEFSKNNKVFYIDNPFTLKDFVLGIFTKKIYSRFWSLLIGLQQYKKLPTHENIAIVTPPLCIPINFLPEGWFYKKLLEINNRIVLSAVNKLIRDRKLSNYIFINFFNPFYLRNKGKIFNPKLFIYYTVDDISYSKYIKKHGPALEDEAIKLADITFATSYELKSLKSKISKNVFYLPNAADTSLFKSDNSESAGKDKLMGTPTIIYIGHIDERIDYELLQDVVAQHPEKIFLMVGPVSIDKKNVYALETFSNVTFVGRKDLVELPEFLHRSNCGIIPFKCNMLTKSIYPLKVNEYLAAGKPVVSTRFSEDIAEFSDVIEVASNSAEFSKMIDHAINSDNRNKMLDRIKRSDQNTWECRTRTFWSIVNQYLTA